MIAGDRRLYGEFGVAAGHLYALVIRQLGAEQPGFDIRPVLRREYPIMGGEVRR